MTFTQWLDKAHKEVTKDISELPTWRQEALRRDEAYALSRQESGQLQEAAGSSTRETE